MINFQSRRSLISVHSGCPEVHFCVADTQRTNAVLFARYNNRPVTGIMFYCITYIHNIIIMYVRAFTTIYTRMYIILRVYTRIGFCGTGQKKKIPFNQFKAIRSLLLVQAEDKLSTLIFFYTLQ